jgi:hypothetical protein
MKTKDEKLIEYWNSLEPFKTTDDIPTLPVVNKTLWDNYFIPKLIELGAISKKDLIDKALYAGSCRNASSAIWHADKKLFVSRNINFWITFLQQ